MNIIMTIFALVLLSNPIFSQETDCDDVNKISCCTNEGNEIPAFNELKCTDDGNLYAMFPQILNYGDYEFNRVDDCNKPEFDGYIGTLQFTYCIPSSRKFMKVSISDFSLSFYQSPEGKATISMDMLMFDPQAINLGSRETPKILKKDILTQQRVFSPRFSPFGGTGDVVEYVGFYQKRYFVKILVDDKEKLFTEPDQFEMFIKDYVEMLNIK